MASTWRAAAVSHNAGLSRKLEEVLDRDLHRRALEACFGLDEFSDVAYLPDEVSDLARRFANWNGALGWIDAGVKNAGAREDAVDEVQAFLRVLAKRRLGFVAGNKPRAPTDWYRYHPDSFESRHD